MGSAQAYVCRNYMKEDIKSSSEKPGYVQWEVEELYPWQPTIYGVQEKHWE